MPVTAQILGPVILTKPLHRGYGVPPLQTRKGELRKVEKLAEDSAGVSDSTAHITVDGVGSGAGAEEGFPKRSFPSITGLLGPSSVDQLSFAFLLFPSIRP